MRDDLGFLGEMVVWIMLCGGLGLSVGAIAGLVVVGYRLTSGLA